MLCAVLAALFCSIAASGLRADISASLDVDVSKPGPAIPKTFYGLMTEEINHAYDGGLFAELIQNRTFQDPSPARRGRGGATQPSPAPQPSLAFHWSVIGDGKASLDRSEPVNPALPVSLRLDLS